MTLKAVEGGDGIPAEPGWSLLYSDAIDCQSAHEYWNGLIGEMRERGLLACANGHQLKRLVVAYLTFDAALRHVAGEGAVRTAKRSKVPVYNIWLAVLQGAEGMATKLEAELGISPRRRKGAAKVEKARRTASAADAYLKPVASKA